MCGIVGYVGRRNAVPILLEGLARVAYRGYDSAGLAVVGRNGQLRVCRRPGKLRELESQLPKRLAGTPGIAHTRWATHGEPSEANAHPHSDTSGRLVIVHNGIVENAAALRRTLVERGVAFTSDTDSECFAHLIASAYQPGRGLEEAVRVALADVEGTYGLLVLSADQPDRIVAARNGSPVIVGVGQRELLVASDVAALVRHTDQVVHLADGELAVLTADGFRTFALDATPTTRRQVTIDVALDGFDRGDYRHFLHKEIHEQPAAIESAIRGRLDDRFATARLGGLSLTPREVLDVRRVIFLGCGSAYYAGLAAAQLVEALARIPAHAEPASEFRYRNPVIERDALYVAISQSGETADTLAAIREVKRKGGRLLALVNIVGSAIARECEGIYLHAGPEISVCSTKAFTSMLVASTLLALHLGRTRDLSIADGSRLINGVRALPSLVAAVLAQEPTIATIASDLAGVRSAFFVGRNRGFAVALEGAQKLKEISYVHAEAYPASELKHGPLALVGREFPVVAILPDDDLFEKNLSTVEQARARHAPVIGIGQARAGDHAHLFDALITVPACEVELAPVLLTIPVQLLAYHAALSLGRDIDQPRHLAKSVTVE
jgi:glutamine---fructose-6-phosphate transaminase (isomerizing)